jgi:hypothetical protein
MKMYWKGVFTRFEVMVVPLLLSTDNGYDAIQLLFKEVDGLDYTFRLEPDT